MSIMSRFRVLLAEKGLREHRSITYRDVVAETGVAISTVQGLANNTLKQVPIEALNAFCEYLNCEVGDILVHKKDTLEKLEKNVTPEPEEALAVA